LKGVPEYTICHGDTTKSLRAGRRAYESYRRREDLTFKHHSEVAGRPDAGELLSTLKGVAGYTI